MAYRVALLRSPLSDIDLTSDYYLPYLNDIYSLIMSFSTVWYVKTVQIIMYLDTWRRGRVGSRRFPSLYYVQYQSDSTHPPECEPQVTPNLITALKT